MLLLIAGAISMVLWVTSVTRSSRSRSKHSTRLAEIPSALSLLWFVASLVAILAGWVWMATT